MVGVVCFILGSATFVRNSLQQLIKRKSKYGRPHVLNHLISQINIRNNELQQGYYMSYLLIQEVVIDFSPFYSILQQLCQKRDSDQFLCRIVARFFRPVSL